MATKEDIANLALTVLGAQQVSNLSTPRLEVEKRVVGIWDILSEQELTRRKWIFSRAYNYKLTQIGYDETFELPYLFQMPAEALTLVRAARDTWQRFDEGIRDKRSELYVELVRDVPVVQWDALFTDVFAAALAVRLAPPLTESNTKYEQAVAWYDRAVTEAARANAFEIGSEPTDGDALSYSWIVAHTYGAQNYGSGNS